MSFCVDLWNGFEIIKDKFTMTHRHIKAFKKLLTNYVSVETEHCKNLDYMYKEFKDTGNLEYPLERSRIQIINMIDYESKERKEFINYITKNILDKMAVHLSEPKISLDQRFLDGTELTTSFKKTLDKLIGKQENFHNQCKELSSYISQLELDNNMNNKMALSKCQKILNKVIKSRDEYLLYINETNIERNKYNLKIEELLNDLEKTYRNSVERFKEYLSNFGYNKYLFLKKLYDIEKFDYENYHSKIDLDQDILLFIMENATKEFPMVKIEFCPFKSNAIGKFIRSKYHDKLNEKDYNRVIKTIQQYFQKHNVFPDNLIQTGISKLAFTKNQFDFFSTIRFNKIKEKEKNNNILDPTKKLNTLEDKIRDKTPEEKEMIILNNINFIKNFINELITNGKVKLYEDKLNMDDNIFKLNSNSKDERNKMDTNKKVNELFKLIDISNESSDVYIEALIKILSYLRSKGYFEINKFNYNLLQLIFMRILEENPKNDYMLKNIIILAQTFYNVDGEDKIYLQKGIKGNEILNNPETWHRCINYTIALANTEKDLTIPFRKNEVIAKIKKEANVNVTSYLSDLKIFSDNQYTFDIVKYFYTYIYELNEKEIEENVQEYLKSYNKKLKINKKIEVNKKKDLKDGKKKEDKKEEKKEIVKDVNIIEEKQETKEEIKVNRKDVIKEEIKGGTKEEIKEEMKEEARNEIKEEVKDETNEEIKEDNKDQIKEDIKENKEETKDNFQEN